VTAGAGKLKDSPNDEPKHWNCYSNESERKIFDLHVGIPAIL
jgi:hypothetical protein